MIIATSKWQLPVMPVMGASLIRPLSSQAFTESQEQWLIHNGYATAVDPDQIITSLPEPVHSVSGSVPELIDSEADAVNLTNDDQTQDEQTQDEQEPLGEEVLMSEPEVNKPKRSRK